MHISNARAAMAMAIDDDGDNDKWHTHTQRRTYTANRRESDLDWPKSGGDSDQIDTQQMSILRALATTSTISSASTVPK